MRSLRFHPNRSNQSHTDSRGEAGETLVEILLTVVLLGTAVVALLTAMMAVTVSSSASRRRAQATNESTTVAEAIDRVPYVNCGGVNAYNGQLATVPTPGFAATITRVEYVADVKVSPASFTTGCPSPDRGVQRITIRVVSTAGSRVTTNMTVTKRRAVCPATVVTSLGETC